METKFKIAIAAAAVAIVSAGAAMYLKRKAKKIQEVAASEAQVTEDKALKIFNEAYLATENTISLGNVFDTLEETIADRNGLAIKNGDVVKMLDALGCRSIIVGTVLGAVAVEREPSAVGGRFNIYMSHELKEYLTEPLWYDTLSMLTVVLGGNFTDNKNIGQWLDLVYVAD